VNERDGPDDALTHLPDLDLLGEAFKTRRDLSGSRKGLRWWAPFAGSTLYVDTFLLQCEGNKMSGSSRPPLSAALADRLRVN